MKNGLRLWMLLLLFIGVAIHASDDKRKVTYEQKIAALVHQRVSGTTVIEYCSTVHPSILYVYVPSAKFQSVCMHKPVFTHDGVDYMLTNIAFKDEFKITRLILTPLNQATKQRG